MRRFAAVIMALVLGVYVCACTAGTTTGSHTGMILQVTRTPGEKAAPVTFEKTVTDASAVQQLYRAAIALPKAPGEQLCPTVTEAGFIDYHLTFQQGTTQLIPMTLRPWVCWDLLIGAINVRGANDVRRTDETFLDLFAQTIGVAPTAL
jgi:hypothetical protein